MTNKRLTYEEQLQSAKAFMLEHDDFLVVSHVQPDGDAASSTMAVGWLLDFLGKAGTLINEGNIPEKFGFLYGSDKVKNFTADKWDRTFNRVITVDCADRARLGKVAQLIAADALILNIDHHSTNDHFGSHQLIDEHAAATVQILFDLAGAMNVNWDKALAECIYTGLLTDTGGFRYSNTSPRVFEIASCLLQHGINNHELAEILLERVSYAHIQLLQRGLNTLRFDADRKIGSVVLTAADILATKAQNEDFEGIVHYPLRIEGVEVGLLFKETKERKVKVSFRSAGKVDVAAIAQEFGGGGHVRAAGATLEEPMNEVIEAVVGRIKKALDE